MRRSLIGLAGLMSLMAWEGVAQSPFGLKVETDGVAAERADVRIVLDVPEKHVIYAESFKVTAEPLRLPAPEQKPDPVDRSKTVGVYAHPFESLWRLSPVKDGVRLTVAYQGCDDRVCFMPEEHVFRFDAAAGRFVAEGAGGALDVRRSTLDRQHGRRVSRW